MARTFDEGDFQITVDSSQKDCRNGKRWKATAVAVNRGTGSKAAEIRTLAEHGTSEGAENRALLMLRNRLAGDHVAD